MTTMTLYRYEREPGKVTVSPTQPVSGDYTFAYRLIAGTGKLLTLDGEQTTPCIDVSVTDGWYEVDDPDYEPTAENDESAVQSTAGDEPS